MNKNPRILSGLLILLFLLVSLLTFYLYIIWHHTNSPDFVSNIKTGILKEVNISPGQLGEGYKEIIPGFTTRNEVVTKLGGKYERKIQDGYEYLIYKYDPGQISDDVVVMINEKGVVERLNHRAELKLNGTDRNYWLQKYCDPEVLTYSNYDTGVYEYIYPSRGVWFRVYRDNIIISWFYFKPASSKIFLETIGKEFPLNNPFIK